MPLVDAAPLIVAAELGYFEDEGIPVRLDKQIGWGNVRDRLNYGQLHASHAPLGMVPASLTGQDYYDQPLAALMCLGAGGNAITVSPALASNPNSTPRDWRRQLGRPINVAHVFSVASHRYTLTTFLHASGLQIGHDVVLCVVPPPQMPALLQAGAIDIYCAGEPWNTLAVTRKTGVIVRASTELSPDHPEKVLAVTRDWYEHNTAVAEKLVRAAIRGCDYCDDTRRRSRLIELLARPAYLNVSESVIDKSLSIDDWLRPTVRRPAFRTFSRDVIEPRVDHADWIIRQMIRWGPLSNNINIGQIARESMIPDAFAAAAASFGSAGHTNTSLQGILK